MESLSLHYTEELKSQAAKILGAVDFLGNPLGLFDDVTEGLSGLLKDGNVGGLFKNTLHGTSNTFSKVQCILSYRVSTRSSHTKLTIHWGFFLVFFVNLSLDCIHCV